MARSQRDQLLELGIEPIHLFHATKSGKNASDLRLAVDAVDLLYQSPIDTFVIVSTDSDFVPLVSRLRSGGKMVIGAGPQKTAPRTLIIACDRFFYLKQGKETPTARISPKRPQVDQLLVRAMRASMDEQGRVVGSKLYQTLQRLDPGFDFRARGHTTFTKFLEASPRVKVTRPRGSDDVVVEVVDTDSALGDDSSNADIWGPKIDAAWASRAQKPGEFVTGTTAAAAASILGVPRLSASRYKTLQRLFDDSELLRSGWTREGNRVVRRHGEGGNDCIHPAEQKDGPAPC